MALTEKKIKFCNRYFETSKGVESAEFAGYSKKTAKQQAYNLLQEPEVEEYLFNLRKVEAEKHGVTRERIISEYAKIAFFDFREIYNVDGGLIDIKQIDDNSAGAIASIKSTEEWGEDDNGHRTVIGTNKEIKVFDKIRALQDLGKTLGIFEKDNRQKESTVTIFQLPDNGR